MTDIEKLLRTFEDVCNDPRGQLEALAAAGKKAVGVLPAFCPEELVYAAGMLPFGVWGRKMRTTASGRHLPNFYCAILHTALEMGIKGELTGLSAVMIPTCCDSLKGIAANWKYAVPDIPMLHVSYAENRKTEAGVTYTAAQFRKLLAKLEAIAGVTVSDDDLRAAITVYNDNREALAAFSRAAAAHPESVSVTARSLVYKAGYFMDRKAHTEAVRELTEALAVMPEEPWKGPKVVTTGIIADDDAFLKILDENGFAIAADQILYESVGCGTPAPEDGDPVRRIALRLGSLEGSSLLYDPEKKRGTELVELVRKSHADGVIWVMTKFCDPEEFDYVPVKQMLSDAGIPLLTIESDRQTDDAGRMATAVEAFRERLLH